MPCEMRRHEVGVLDAYAEAKCSHVSKRRDSMAKLRQDKIRACIVAGVQTFERAIIVALATNPAQRGHPLFIDTIVDPVVFERNEKLAFECVP